MSWDDTKKSYTNHIWQKNVNWPFTELFVIGHELTAILRD